MTHVKDILNVYHRDNIIFNIDKKTGNIVEIFHKINNLSELSSTKFTICNKLLAIDTNHNLYYFHDSTLIKVDTNVKSLLSDNIYTSFDGKNNYIYYNSTKNNIKIIKDIFPNRVIIKHKLIKDVNFVLFDNHELCIYHKNLRSNSYIFKYSKNFFVTELLDIYTLYVICQNRLHYYNITNHSIVENKLIMTEINDNCIISYPYIIDVVQQNIYSIRLYGFENTTEFVAKIPGIKNIIKANGDIYAAYFVTHQGEIFLSTKKDVVLEKPVFKKIKLDDTQDVYREHIHIIDNYGNLWYNGKIIKKDIKMND